MKPLRAISLWQPWATLMAIGAKKIETRSWPTTYRGLVAIHAAKKWNRELRTAAFETAPFNEYAAELPRGCLVAVGNLSKCLSTDEHPHLIPARDSHEYAFGDYGPGRYMWVFDHVWQLPCAIYVRGQQGFWTLDAGETDTVEALMPDGWEEELQEA